MNDPFDFACLASRDPTERQRLRDYRRENSEKFALLCFSGDWHNPVQWSHYAERHKGFALKFAIPDEHLLTVEYGAMRPTFSSSATEEELLKIANYKYSHWSYEKERRAIVLREECSIDSKTGNWFYPFNETVALREVILGARCAAKMADVSEALGDLAAHTVLRRARLSFKRFAVVTQRNRAMQDTFLE